MSIQIKKYIDSIWSKIQDTKYVKKKGKTIIKDGIFSFKLDLENDKKCSMCKTPINNCSLLKCHHIYYLLIKYYKVDFDDLKYIFKNDNLKNMINKKKYIIQEEDRNCPLCLDECDNYNNTFQCMNCSQVYHSKCLRKFRIKKCPICKTNL